MPRLRPFILLCALALAACSFTAKWRDTSGQQRSQEQAQRDARHCADASGVTSLGKNSTGADYAAFKSKLDACMADRGWQFVRDDS